MKASSTFLMLMLAYPFCLHFGGLPVLCLLTPCSAAASEPDPKAEPAPDAPAHNPGERGQDTLDTSRRDAAAVTRDGTFLPYTLTPRVGEHRVAAMLLGGYDTAVGQGPVMSGWVEGALFGRVALRVGIDYLTVKSGQIGPNVGLRVGILRAERHGIDLAAGVVYLNRGLPQPNGEPDGQIEVVLSAGRRIGNLGLFGNVAYDQGIDPRERALQLRLAGLYALGHYVNLGLDLKGRFDLTDAHEKDVEHVVSDFDLVGGPLVVVSFSHIMLMAQAGARLQKLHGPDQGLAAGLVATGGMGTSF